MLLVFIAIFDAFKLNAVWSPEVYEMLKVVVAAPTYQSYAL